MKSITISYSKQDRLALAGAVAFSGAVLVQLVQVAQLSASLWTTLFASSISIPFGVVALLMEAEAKRLTGQHMICWALSVGATLVATVGVFWHFSMSAGLLAIVSFLAAIVLSHFHEGQQRHGEVTSLQNTD